MTRRTHADDRPDTAGCLPHEALVAYVEGRLGPEAGERVEEHVASCDLCRGLIVDVGADTVRVAAPERERARRLGWLAVAAAVLVAGAIGTWALTRGGSRPSDPDAALVALAQDLAKEEPDLFEGFTPIGPEERRAPGDVTRGGFAILEPAGSAEQDRPTFRWTPAGGASGYVVDVRRLDGEGETWSREVGDTTTLAYPADAPALERGVEYVAEVTARAPAGLVYANRGLRVATATELARLQRAMGLLRSRAPAGLGPLAAAHYAARNGWLRRAEGELTARARGPAEEDLLRWIRRSLGLAAAEDAPR